MFEIKVSYHDTYMVSCIPRHDVLFLENTIQSYIKLMC